MDEAKLSGIFEDLGFQISLEDFPLKVPLVFKERFEWKRFSFLNLKKSCLLIKEKREGSLNSFIKQAKVLSERGNLEFILLFPSIPKEIRRILLKSRIPFIDYRGNMFLPMLSLILKEDSEAIKLPKKFTKNEQTLLIYILLSHKEFFSYKDLIQDDKFSQATVFRVLNKFIQLGWIESVNDSYVLAKSKEEIFMEAKDSFFNPVQKEIFVKESILHDYLEEQPSNYVIAGAKALSERSFLYESEMTYAVSKKRFAESAKEDWVRFETFDKKIPDTSELQIWKYDPTLLNNQLADPISLYLTLQDEEDPRVEQAMKELLQNNLK